MREALAKGLGVSQLAGCSPKSAAPVCYDSQPSALGATAAMHMGRLMHGSGDVVVPAEFQVTPMTRDTYKEPLRT